jgi:hypothetical protein
VSYRKAAVKTFQAIVVVGNTTHLASKLVPQLIALAEPLSFILNISFWKLTGVPVKFVVIEVIASACAVIVTAQVVSVLIVGVADETIVVTQGVHPDGVSQVASQSASEVNTFQIQGVPQVILIAGVVTVPVNVGEAIGAIAFAAIVVADHVQSNAGIVLAVPV